MYDITLDSFYASPVLLVVLDFFQKLSAIITENKVFNRCSLFLFCFFSVSFCVLIYLYFPQIKNNNIFCIIYDLCGGVTLSILHLYLPYWNSYPVLQCRGCLTNHSFILCFGMFDANQSLSWVTVIH